MMNKMNKVITDIRVDAKDLQKIISDVIEKKINCFKNEIKNEISEINDRLKNIEYKISKLEEKSKSKSVSSDKFVVVDRGSEDIVNYEDKFDFSSNDNFKNSKNKEIKEQNKKLNEIHDYQKNEENKNPPSNKENNKGLDKIVENALYNNIKIIKYKGFGNRNFKPIIPKMNNNLNMTKKKYKSLSSNKESTKNKFMKNNKKNLY